MTLLAAVLGVIISIGAIDSFAQTDLTMVGSTQDRGSNATAASASLGNPFFVEQGRITGQRVLAIAPQPQLESSFMANASINSVGGNVVINAINTGTTVSTLNDDDRTFGGKGQGILRTEGGDMASWTSQSVGNLTPEGNIMTHGVTLWSTPSTAGELAFMNGMIGLFEFQLDGEGNLSVREWEWESGIGNNVGAAPPMMQGESPINSTSIRTSEPSPTVTQ